MKDERSLVPRRVFLSHSAGLGGLALLDMLLGSNVASAANIGSPGALAAPHHPPTAKRVIFLFMAGPPSQLECFDYKPKLKEMHGKETPASILGTQRLSTMVKGQSTFPIVAPIAPLRQHGSNGAWVSDGLPHIASTIDD